MGLRIIDRKKKDALSSVSTPTEIPPQAKTPSDGYYHVLKDVTEDWLQTKGRERFLEETTEFVEKFLKSRQNLKTSEDIFKLASLVTARLREPVHTHKPVDIATLMVLL